MPNNLSYALMAGGAYFSTRTEVNKFSSPQGWTSFAHQALSSGFEAISYVSGNEIVISYAGTYPDGLAGDNEANIVRKIGVRLQLNRVAVS